MLPPTDLAEPPAAASGVIPLTSGERMAGQLGMSL